MIKYFPKNRITVNKYTRGNEFLLNGESYTGAYYVTFNNKIYSGPDPVNGSSQELVKIELDINELRINNKKSNISINDKSLEYISNPNIKNLQTYKIPPQSYPTLTNEDYAKGYIMRYFAKKRNDIGYVIEISKDIYLSLQSKDSEYDYITYQTIDLFWQITGPLNDTRENRQYKIAGIIDTNKRLVETKDKSFRGLIEYIGEKYDKYARPTQ